MRKCAVIIFLLWVSVAKAQTIVTFAGTGANTVSGDNGPATAAGIPNPAGGAFDSYGNYYFAEAVNGQRIRKVSPAGIITTVAGGMGGGFSGDSGPATAAKLNDPVMAIFDTSGNFYISDNDNMRVRKVNISTGVITTIAGSSLTGGFGGDNGPATAALLFGPNGICFDKSGNLYIADEINHRIRKVDESGIITTFAGTGTAGSTGDGGPATSAEIRSPAGLAIDDTGNLYIADVIDNYVRKVDTFGIISTIAGNGNGTYVGDGVPATAAQINPAWLAFDASGQLFIADKYNKRIFSIDFAGIIHLVAGNGSGGFSGDNGPATAASLDFPNGISFDPCGNLYIPEGNSNHIRKVIFNTSGTPSVNISASPGDTLCAGTVVTYSATVTGSSTFAYQWYRNGTTISGATVGSYTYVPTNGDSVRCLFTGTDLCGGNTETVSSNTINMVVNNLAEPSISLSAPIGASSGTLVTVTATVTGAGSSYNIKWFDRGILFNTTTVPMVTYTKSALYTDTITATVVPGAGCYDSAAAIAVYVYVSEGVASPGLFKEDVVVYPNPAGGVLHIDLSGARGGVSMEYKIVSVVGAVIQHGLLHEGDNSIPVRSLPAGTYMVEVQGSDGVRVIRKIVKQ